MEEFVKAAVELSGALAAATEAEEAVEPDLLAHADGGCAAAAALEAVGKVVEACELVLRGEVPPDQAVATVRRAPAVDPIALINRLRAQAARAAASLSSRSVVVEVLRAAGSTPERTPRKTGETGDVPSLVEATNERMLGAIQADNRRAEWTIRDWAGYLKVSTYIVGKTAAWATFKRLRGNTPRRTDKLPIE